MQSEWPEVALGDLITIKHGFAFRGEYFTDTESPFVLITPGNFAIGGGFQEGKPKFYSGPVPQEYVLRPGDLVVTMTDLSRACDTLGFSAVVPEGLPRTYLHNQRVGLVQIRPNAPVVTEWLDLLLRSPEYRAWVVNSATGTTVKHTSPSRICEYKFRLPALPEQRRAAKAIVSIESQIRLIQAKNRALERLAQSIFKSWFVDFEPVHSKHEGLEPQAMDAATAQLFPSQFESVDGRPVPTGWKSSTVGHICTNIRVQAQPDKLPADTPYIGLEHMPRGSIALNEVSTSAALESNKSWFSRNDILFGRLRPYFHKVVLAPFEGVCSTDILVLRPSLPEAHAFIAMHTSSTAIIDYATQLSNGAKMPRTSWRDLAAFPIVVPPVSLLQAFDCVVHPMFERIYANIQVRRTLSEIRDALLPRVVSGKTPAPEENEAIEEEVA